MVLARAAPYAEDQPHSRTILHTHVLHRALTTAPLLSLPLNLSLRAYARKRFPGAPVANLPFLTSLTRTTGIVSVFVMGALEIALLARMKGKEEVEWQDRSWRLLGNRGQQEMDLWGYAGGVGGGVGWVVLRKVRPVGWGGWKAGVGSVGLGNFVGCLGEMGWRAGWKGGRWEEDGDGV